MSGVRFSGAGYALRLRSAAKRERMPGYVPPPDAACVATTLGQRLGIAALYAGQGDEPNARAAALLALVGMPDSPEHRAGLAGAFDQVAQLVRAAASTSHRGAIQ